mgnify:CR=1 FL=1
MKLIEAKEITGGLSRTSKLECGSFSLSAFDCVTGSKLAKVKDSVCNKCYARRNSYLYPSVKTAQARRIKKLNNPNWAEAMVKLGDDRALAEVLGNTGKVRVKEYESSCVGAFVNTE